jgi:alanine racemase
MPPYSPPLRLELSCHNLVANYRALARASGKAQCGAAVKADGYGLGARAVLEILAAEGCRDFFVATWGEALALGHLPKGVALSVLHGVRVEDMALARAVRARPVLNTHEQIKRWRETGLPCDVMVDTGMNRLGVSLADVEAGALKGLDVDILMSHLACADEDSPRNEAQRAAFATLAAQAGSAKRMSLANSAGIYLGAGYHFQLTRPGLALYGGVPRAEASGHLRQVARLKAQVLQKRVLRRGESIGYNATYVAQSATPVAIVNMGYADGYARAFSGTQEAQGGTAGGEERGDSGRADSGHGDSDRGGEGRAHALGRVSMDLTAFDISALPHIAEGDWLEIDFDLPQAAARAGRSQYELLTGLGARAERRWV